MVSGSGGLTKLGAGSLELGGTGNNTFSGSLNINEGTLQLNLQDPMSAPLDTVLEEQK